jgi:DnaJ-class molecular chaperone
MAVEFKDYYKILGVERRADDKTIKSAYRKLARKYHPDVAKDKNAIDRFKEVTEAYEVLSDPDKRQRYDALGPDWQRYAQGPTPPPGSGGFRVEYGGDLGDLGDFSDFFRTIFGDLGEREARGGARGGARGDDWLGDAFRQPGGRARPRGRQDVQANLEITLEEAFNGTRKTFAMEREEACPACKGAGNVGGKPCALCHGTGWQRIRHDVDVRIPAGVRTGERVRVSGEGAGVRGARGDLYLAVTVAPHPVFERKGDDLLVTVPITAPEAALGTTLEVPSLRGKVTMKVPPGTSSGRTFRLPGYGMPRVRAGGTGDELVSVRIVMPAALTREEAELYAKLKGLRDENPRGQAQG